MIACVAVPYFVAAVERRAGHGLSDEPLAVGGQPWEARPVYAFSHEAAGLGVHRGMSLRLVQLLSPTARFLPAVAPHYAQVSAEIVDVLTDFSPDIEPQELWHSFPDSSLAATAHGRSLPARYCLDLDSLPQSEAVPLIQELGRRVRGETRFDPAIGLAADPFTAQVAAAVCRPSRLLPVAADGAADFLASRPLDFLPLAKEPARRLRLLGIGTLGQLAGLPLSALREQFGPEIEPLHRLAAGAGDAPLRPQPAQQRATIRRDFDHPLANTLLLADALAHLAGELAGRLQAASLEGRSLRLTLEPETGPTWQHALTLRRPTAAAERLTAALQELAATADVPGGVTAIAVEVADLTPTAAYQLGLFDGQSATASFYRAMQNLVAKHKTCGFYRPTLTERGHPLPERRFQFEALDHDPALA